MKTKLPEGWKEVELKDLIEDMHQGINTVIENIAYLDKGYFIIQSKHITGGELDLSDARFVSKEDYDKYKEKYNPKKGDLLICNIGTIGKSIVVKKNQYFLIAWNLFLLKLKKEAISSEFLKLYLDKLNSESYFDKFLTGGTVKFINKTKMGSISIPLPPLPTQQKIVSILEKAEKAKEWRKEADELTKDFLKAVFVEMFGDIKLQEFSDEIFNIIDGDRGVNYPHGDDFSDEGYCLFLNTGNVRKDGFNFDNLMFINKDKDEQLRKGKVSLNDVILTTRGTVGNVALYDQYIKFKHVRINSGMVLLRPNLKKIDPTFLFALIQMPIMQEQFKQANSGTAQPQLPITNLRKIKIPLPPLPLQQKFTSIVKEVEAMKEHQKHSKEQIDKLFNALMQKAFKGELIL